MGFLERFLELSSERGLNITDIAKQTNLPRSTVSSYVNRKSMPSAVQLEILANFFNCSIDFLVGRTDDDGYLIAKPAHTTLPNSAVNLTEDERELLKAFSKLSADNKKSIIIQVKALSQN